MWLRLQASQDATRVEERAVKVQARLEAYGAELDARERQLHDREGDLSASMQQYNNLGLAPCSSAFCPALLAFAPCPLARLFALPSFYAFAYYYT